MTDTTTTESATTPAPKARRHILPLVRELRRVAARIAELDKPGGIAASDMDASRRCDIQEDALLTAIMLGKAVAMGEAAHQIVAALDALNGLVVSDELPDGPVRDRIEMVEHAVKSALPHIVRAAGLTPADLWSQYGVGYATV